MPIRPLITRPSVLLSFLSLVAIAAPSVAHAQAADTVIVFGPRQYTRVSGVGGTTYNESFSASPVAGRRFVLEVVNGNPDVTLRVSHLTVVINNTEVLGRGELTTTISALSRVVSLASSNNAQLTIEGDVGSRVTVRLVSVPDPTFAVFGPETFTRGTGEPQTVSRSFALPAGAGAPFLLVLVNGAPDGSLRASSGRVWVNGSEVIGTSDIKQDIASVTRQVALTAQNLLEVRLTSAPGSFVTIRVLATDIAAPLLTITSPAEALLTALTSVTAAGAVQDATAVNVTVNGTAIVVGSDRSFSGSVPLPAEGRNLLLFIATDAAGNHADSTRTVFRDTQAPTLTVSQPAENAATTNAAVSVSGTATDSSAFVLTLNGDTLGVGAGGAFGTSRALALGSNTLTLVATDVLGHAAIVVRHVTRNSTGPTLPPDPATVAPALDQSGVPLFASATSFLYSGATPIQTGVAAGTIEARRAAVIRGRVLMRDGQPLSGVTIRILNHSEFGQTLSRTDGRFDLAVNGGGQLVVTYDKSGYLGAQRQIDLPWRDYVAVDDVALVGIDPNVTSIDFSAPIQVARGSSVSDTSGTRRATLMFKQGTTATMVMPDNSTQPLGSLHARATEYTVGPNGPLAMPAELPISSAYTYCAEFSVDEAQAAGAKSVSFSQPVSAYLENFLGFPVGTPVPAGFLDRQKSQWVEMPNGRVIRVLAATSGIADVDANGDSLADSQPSLDSLGVTTEERRQLASLYVPGQSLWRVALDHFSSVDLNWGYRLAQGAVGPGTLRTINVGQGINNSCHKLSSIIECQNRVLGQRLPVVGTPYTLNYRSYRVAGQLASRMLDIPLIGATVPPTLKRIDLEVDVQGERFRQSFAPTPNQTFTYTWDGKDAYGRALQGRQPATVRISYVYPRFYVLPPTLGESFGLTCIGNACALPASFEGRADEILSTTQRVGVGAMEMRAAALGSWTLDVHHAYDALGSSELYRGDGERLDGNRLAPVVRNLRGGLDDFVAAPDGSFYVLRSDGPFQSDKVYKVAPDGTEALVAGNGNIGFGGDEQPATLATLNRPTHLALGPDGSIYIADTFNGRLRKVTTDGIIHTVVGNGSNDCSGPREGPGLALSFALIANLAVAKDGSVYFTSNCPGIFRLGTDGMVTLLPGTDVSGFGTGGLAFGPDGSLFIACSDLRVRKINPEGSISVVAGSGNSGYGGDGFPAQFAYFFLLSGLAVGNDGTIYIADVNGWIRQVSPDGIITTLGGTGDQSGPGNGMPAAGTGFFGVGRLQIDSEGNLNFLDLGVLSQIRPVAPGFTVSEIAVASEDGRELYVFDATGLHLRTVDALTGAIRYQFAYDARRHLISVTDIDRNVTTIERDAAGNPTAIVGPYGQRTTLAVDTNGYLASIANPSTQTVLLTADSGGLLTALRDPRSNLHRFHYDALGLLESDNDPAGGAELLARTGTNTNYTVTRTTAEGRTTQYGVSDVVTGGLQRTVTGPEGLTTTSVEGLDGKTTTTSPDGTVSTLVESPDPRFAMQSPVLKSLTVRTPSGLTSAVTGRRDVGFGAGNPLDLALVRDQVTVNGHVYQSSFTYNSGVRQFTDLTPLGRQTVTTVDSAGRPLSIAVPGLATVSSQYDTRGRLSQSQQGGRVWSYGYDASGRLHTITDPLLRVTSFEYDNADRLTRQVLPDLREIHYGYDASGNLTSLTPPGRPAHGFDYTSVDLTQHYTPPDVGIGATATAYSYNHDRQLTRIARPDGANVDLGYDPAGRLATVTIPRGAITFGYSGTSGNLTSLTSPDGVSLAYSYDGSLPTQESWSGAIVGSVSLSYDANFRPVSQSVNGGSTVAFGYDDDGLLTSAGALTLTRDPANGLLTGTTLGNVTTSQGYSGAGELASFVARYSGTPLFQTNNARDSLGRITAIDETVQGVSTHKEYRYDLAGRLSEVYENGTRTALYEYDANGNRIRFTGATAADTATALYDDEDRMLRYGNARYSYTANGELALKAEGTDTTRYTYDELGNLITVILPNHDRIDYLIDGQNRRVGKKLNGRLVKGWLYQNGLNPIAELDSAGSVVSRFVYGSRGHVPDYMIRGGVTYRIITDHLGSVRLVTDVSTGGVSERLDYDAFGQVRLDTAPGLQPLGFAGGLWETATGLVRFGARDYETVEGRWIASEARLFNAVGSPDAACGISSHQYAYGDPVDYIDPDGLTPEGAVAGAFVGGLIGNAVGRLAGTGLAAGVASAVTFVAPGVGTLGVGIPLGIALGQAGAITGTVVGAAAGAAAGNALSDLTANAVNMARHEAGQRNYISDEAEKEARRTGKDICTVLDEMLAEAKRCGDAKRVSDIISQQKYHGCRNIRKR